MIPEVLATAPHEVAPDTFLIPTLAPDPATGAFIGAHSLVIRGTEPVIVDTGCALVTDHWADQVFSVVEPEDVRWIYVSHDDHDHVGNVEHTLERCPNATLVANFVLVSRLAGDVDLPFDRMRWLDVGESFDAGDRSLTVVRPPLFDSPSSRGFVDSATGVFWAVDSFGALFPGETYEAADVPDELYTESFRALNSWNTPGSSGSTPRASRRTSATPNRSARRSLPARTGRCCGAIASPMGTVAPASWSARRRFRTRVRTCW